jgi:hypothetical protein
MGTARRQAEYLLVVGQNDEVVLRQYGDVIVSARINRISKQIAKIYTVRKLSAEKPISFQSEEVGPLTLENISKDAKSNSAESDKSIVKPNIELKRDAAKDRRAP